MPALESEFDVTAGPVSQTGGTGDNYADVTGVSITLTAGRWWVRARASHVNVTGSGGITRSSEVEVRHNTTRYGMSRWCSLFGSFRPSVAAGGILATFFVIDASNGDTVTMRLRRENVDGTDDGAVEAGDCVLEAILLDELDEGTDYWVAQATNSDTAEVTAGDATWITAAVGGRIGQDASEVDLTAPSTGDYYVCAAIEGFINGTPGSAEESRARFRVDGAAAGTGIEHAVTHTVGSPTAYVCNFHEEDVIALTLNDTPEIQWEVANNASGDASGFRRSRIFVLRLAALADYEFIANAGNINLASAGTTEASNAVSYNFGTTDSLISGSATFQTGGGNWGRAWLHQDTGDVHHPASGRLQAVPNDGVASGDDELPIAFGTIRSSTGAEVWRLALQSDSGANAYSLGRNRGNSAEARTILIAMQLETAAGTTLTGTTAINSPIPTIAASGRRNRSGTVAITAPVPTIASSGGQERRGPVAITVPVPTIAASGRRERSGTVAMGIPLPTIAASGRFNRSGTVAMTIPLPQIAAREVEPEPTDPYGGGAVVTGIVVGDEGSGAEVVGGVIVTGRS